MYQCIIDMYTKKSKIVARYCSAMNIVLLALLFQLLRQFVSLILHFQNSTELLQLPMIPCLNT